MVIIPTELIPDNGQTLQSIVEQLANINNLDASFIDWLKNANYFCNSLVDRIVPGKPPLALQTKMEDLNGYEDELMIMSEVYRLWAIESSEPKVSEILSFSRADSGVVIAGDIEVYRELKLRLLNGAHTFSCGLAHLAGFATVKEAMNDAGFAAFITKLMMDEIAPAITSGAIAINDAIAFAAKVLDRFRNPHIEHQWLSITMQYSSKMKTRNLPIIQNFLKRIHSAPECISLGLAAHLLFMKCELGVDGKFYGEVSGKKYLVNDDNAHVFAEKWKTADTIDGLVRSVFSDLAIWGMDLSQHRELINTITSKLQELSDNGCKIIIGKYAQPTKPAQII
jgi:tagaturonate reductase